MIFPISDFRFPIGDRAALLAAPLAWIFIVMSGCSRPAGEILVAPGDAPVWPPPPAAPRVRYVDSIRSADDLKPAQSFWQQLAGHDDADRPKLVAPNSVAVSPSRQVYVADSYARCVHSFDLNTRAHTLIGAGVIQLPAAVAYGDGRLFVADCSGGAVHVFDGATLRPFNRSPIQRPAGLVYVAADSAETSLGSEMSDLKSESATGGSASGGIGNLYVSDLATASIHVLNAAGETVRRFPSTSDPGEALSAPTHLAYHPRTGLLVTDSLSGRIVRFALDGRRLGVIGSPGDGPGNLALPRGVAVDQRGHIYVVDARFENVQVFDAEGRVLMAFGHEGVHPGEFCLPAGICTDEQNRIWVADTYNCRVQVFQFLGAPEPAAEPSAVASGQQREEAR